MAIRFFSDDVSDLVSRKKKKLSGFFVQIITAENCMVGNLNFIFCSDTYLLSINKQFLNHDYLTDIITFDYSENKTVSGDIYISVERIKENAEKYKVVFFEELCRIMIHGILHLIGYEDKTTVKKKMMTQKENEYLELMQKNVMMC